ncbi:response regulator [Afifella sp. IM 167]|nr:response regulator [Afifella sp. IM 167]
MVICDDELELANEIGEFFQSHGWRVSVCGTAKDVRAILSRGFAPLCLLTDLRLKEEDGTELIAFARTLPPALRPGVCALITGHAADPAVGDNLGADLLYFKPADPFDILADLERYAERVAAQPA